ncbi:hypothetical protein ACFST9_13090 [Hymenobacter monticola]|uniref:Uncharacterized protein n=1 Tax=Hymenobacter monticola TaxID=1705399 RepID=A0ABY4BBH5_9BACT|nr:hypothetical protein [Hymenobacter monticola]UOE36420.1 hypothetical protein MTP16_23985 [Hymenobacter monticola]
MNCWTQIKEFAHDYLYPLLKDFIIPLAGAGVGAWASLSVFKRQTEENRRTHEQSILNNFKEEHDRQNKLAEKNLNHFTWLLDDLIGYVEKQTHDYVDTAKEIKRNPTSPHPLSIRASGTLERLFSIRNDDIFFSLIRKALDTADNRARVARIYKQLDFIKFSMVDYRLAYKSHIKLYHKIGKEYRENIEAIRNINSDIIEQSRKNGALRIDPLALYLDELRYFYVYLVERIPGATGLTWHHAVFLRPFMKELLDDFRHDSRVDAIFNIGRRNNILMGRILHSSEDAITGLERGNRMLTEAIEKLRPEVDYIKQVLLTT